MAVPINAGASVSWHGIRALYNAIQARSEHGRFGRRRVINQSQQMTQIFPNVNFIFVSIDLKRHRLGLTPQAFINVVVVNFN